MLFLLFARHRGRKTRALDRARNPLPVKLRDTFDPFHHELPGEGDQALDLRAAM
jgi:hypothetical protein